MILACITFSTPSLPGARLMVTGIRIAGESDSNPSLGLQVSLVSKTVNGRRTL